MKLSLVGIAVIAMLSLQACKDGTGKTNTPKPKTEADSLLDDIEEGHMEAMSKYSRLQGLASRIQAIKDSISGLPAKAKEALAPYSAQLDSAGESVRTAISSMDKWMDEFNMDSTFNTVAERVNYFASEKMKVSEINASVRKGLAWADSVIHQK